ncbi:hypothetical protein [Paludibacterium yongneupense]|uniref:hypothetical protein n=1 Tax=Paludibacterium yongneupense TaxID=400061 RepID=UPI000419DC0D|nr:hypothetical protein [Paludibacterium yongneupense]
MRNLIFTCSLLLSPMLLTPMSAPAMADVSIDIGIDIPTYPQLVRVPQSPVYYYPDADSNYFFYDGMYWVYQNDRWYASSWYNGPWQFIGPAAVPVYLLRVPVRYYVQAPPYFMRWRPDAPPRWGEHWGPDWQRRHPGWDHWDRRAAPPPAPLPVYQRSFSGDRYPHSPEQQRALQAQHYRYQPHEPAGRPQGQVPGGMPAMHGEHKPSYRQPGAQQPGQPPQQHAAPGQARPQYQQQPGQPPQQHAAPGQARPQHQQQPGQPQQQHAAPGQARPQHQQQPGQQQEQLKRSPQQKHDKEQHDGDKRWPENP